MNQTCSKKIIYQSKHVLRSLEVLFGVDCRLGAYVSLAWHSIVTNSRFLIHRDIPKILSYISDYQSITQR